MFRVSPYVYPGMKLDSLTAETLLQINTSNSTALSEEEMLNAIVEVLRIDRGALFSQSRYRDIVEARRIAIFHLRKYFYTTHVELGRMMNRDHTTVTHNLKMYLIQMKFDPGFKLKAERVAKILGIEVI